MSIIQNIGQQTQAMDSQTRNASQISESVVRSTPKVDLPEEKEPRLTNQEIEEALKKAETISSVFGNKVRFTVDNKLDKVVIKVIDPNTDKVIKEIPPIALQKMQIRIKEALGLLFDDFA